ncbi:MAG: hypothetical protein ABIE94_05895 [archaeon]
MMTYDFAKQWWETLLIFLFIVGIVISIFVNVYFLDVMIIFAAGILFARLIVPYRKKWQFQYVTLGLGFLVGYLIFAKQGNQLWLFLFFVLGIVITRIFDVFREGKHE